MTHPLVTRLLVRLGTDARSVMLYRNVAQSFLVKGIGIGVSFLTIPLTIRYVSLKDFGIWMTITFLTSWFSLVDVSFGNGLRNSLVAFFGSGDTQTARRYISTLYCLSGLLAVGLTLVFGVVQAVGNWSGLLNIDSDNPGRINLIITYTLVGFSVQLLLKPINSILLADQKAAVTGWILLIINVLTLIGIYIANQFPDRSLLVIAHIYNLVPLVVFGGVSVWFFRRQYAAIAPGWRWVDWSLSRDLVNVGGQFLALQLVSVLVFTSGGLFISYFLGSSQVGPYSIGSKYFSVVTVLYGIVITPYWSAFTDAYVKRDTGWIKRTMRRLNLISVGMSALACLLLLVAKPVLRLWIGPQATIPTELLVGLTAYTISFIFLTNYNSFVNGTGRIGILVRISLIGMMLYILVNIWLFRSVQLGPVSVVVAGTVWNVSLLAVCFFQYRRIMDRLLLNNDGTPA